MKITTIITCALLLIVCGCSAEKKATLTDRQVLELAMKKLPPLPNDAGYFASYRDGNWTVSLLRDIHTNSPTAMIPVAIVNDADRSVDIIKRP